MSWVFGLFSLRLLKSVLIYLILFLIFVVLPSSLQAQSEEGSATAKPTVSTPKSKEAKSTAFMGDPAQKRGFELGYDYGVKAGKNDKKLGKKQNPTGHEDYSMAAKKHRSEYGNQGRFISGFQAGFMRGYKSGFSRETTDPQAQKKYQEEEKKMKSTETKRKGDASSSVKTTTTSTPLPSSLPPKPKPKRFDPAQDAL